MCACVCVRVCGYMEKTEMYNVLLHQVKERENTFIHRDD